MDVAEIADMTEWDSNELGNLNLTVPLFAEDLPFLLFPEPGAGPVVTEKMTATINDVLALPPAELQRIKQMLWDEANFAFQVADYGVDPEGGETPLQAHLREFGITTPEDAYEKSTVREVHIFDEFIGRFAEIKVDTGAENRISIIVKNGRIIDWDGDGTHLGWFDNGEESAAKKRHKMLE
ncbi:hypothetical protein [Allorhizobium taibaishanense]|uniref:Uncharacterized protein n=1 Tax=Allorhizobium taibaishanense TaxID=887144 RepID=A0A1Q9AB99_9HYPH|nr:hypothetical protein [Allorhizobium taibaishanense]MBB4010112.1 hypothetical protein [Allorhizobium taibaishanense]OLP52125.1 hypothetical protein BJF91_02465 [Allorhizobium taibaishanense]